MSKKYTVIGRIGESVYDLLLDPVSFEDALGHAAMQNDIVPEMMCRVVEWKKGQYRPLPSLDTPNVKRRKDSIEELLSDVSFDGVRPDYAVKEYKDGFEVKQNPSKPSQRKPKKSPVEPAPDYSLSRHEIIRTSQPAKQIDHHAVAHAAEMERIKSDVGTFNAYHDDPIAGTSRGYVPAHEKYNGNSWLVVVMIVVIAALAIAGG